MLMDGTVTNQTLQESDVGNTKARRKEADVGRQSCFSARLELASAPAWRTLFQHGRAVLTVPAAHHGSAASGIDPHEAEDGSVAPM